MVQEAHADIITHSPRDKAVDGWMIARMLEDNCISVPITMTKAVSQPPSLRKKYEHSRDSVTVMYQAGIPSWQKRIAMTNPIPPWTCLMGNPSIWNWNCWLKLDCPTWMLYGQRRLCQSSALGLRIVGPLKWENEPTWCSLVAIPCRIFQPRVTFDTCGAVGLSSKMSRSFSCLISERKRAWEIIRQLSIKLLAPIFLLI